MPFIRVDNITKELVTSHPDWLFLFGDNIARLGFGGQAAVMRGQPNAIGIRTKKFPNWNEQSYFTDAEYEQNCRLIAEDFVRVREALAEGRTVVVSSHGLGTGLSGLQKRAPRTLAYIESVLKELEKK